MASVNLRIGGTPIRIASDRLLARQLRKVCGPYLIDEDAPLGFVVQRQRKRPRTFEVMDRCGFALGSAASRSTIRTMLTSHLTALLPVPLGQMRVRTRTLIGPSGAALCFFPLLYAPSPDINRLRSSGHEVVDRLAADIETTTGSLVHVNDSEALFADLCKEPDAMSWTRLPIARLVFAGRSALQPPPSPAVAAAALIQDRLGGERDVVMDAAISAVAGARIQVLDASRPGSLEDALLT